MSYIKNSLPDDWELPDPPTKKYLCVGNKEVKAEWLPRWYEVPYDECMFAHVNKDGNYVNHPVKKYNLPHPDTLLILKVIPNGDYKQHLKELKTEKLLNGY